MANNNIKPFAAAGGANVLTQAAYEALTSLIANGFSSGVAQSAQLNKVWRQSSLMAAILAQYVSDVTGQDVIDDGTTATILTNLKAAVRSQSSPVGMSRNLKAILAAAGTSATWTADELIVETALGGQTYRLAAFNKTLNTATVGAGGMDTGVAPVSGFLAIYAIYNLTTGVSALLGANATAAIAPEIYGGANMPAGYTASALLSVLPTNASSQMVAFAQADRTVSIPFVNILNSSTVVTPPTALSIATVVPKNARWVSGTISSGSSTAGATTTNSVYAAANGVGIQGTSNAASGTGSSGVYRRCPITTVQTIYYNTASNLGTPQFTIAISEYEF